jgi:predicted nucleic acid-binding Zn ribbon protein
MNPEIRELIKLATADGIVSDKERAVIMRKATNLGEDIDEVELILNGELALNNQLQKTEHQSSPPVQSNKEGNLKKCPSCGAPVPSLSLKCSECGHEFRNTEATVSVNEFFKQVKSAKPEDRAMIISNFPIPNNKEDLIEFISMSVGNCKEMTNIEQWNYVEKTGFAQTRIKPELQIRLNEINAWRGKAQASIMKARILFIDNQILLENLRKFEQEFVENTTHNNKTNEQNRKSLLMMLVFIITITLIGMIGLILVGS